MADFRRPVLPLPQAVELGSAVDAEFSLDKPFFVQDQTLVRLRDDCGMLAQIK